jgi:hypothetical protein
MESKVDRLRSFLDQVAPGDNAESLLEGNTPDFTSRAAAADPPRRHRARAPRPRAGTQRRQRKPRRRRWRTPQSVARSGAPDTVELPSRPSGFEARVVPVGTMLVMN